MEKTFRMAEKTGIFSVCGGGRGTGSRGWGFEIFKPHALPCRGKMKTEIQNKVMHSDV